MNLGDSGSKTIGAVKTLDSHHKNVRRAAGQGYFDREPCCELNQVAGVARIWALSKRFTGELF
jgi:hypothetical protein